MIGGKQESLRATKACTQRSYPEANLPDLDSYQLWYDLNKCRPEELEMQRQIACQWMDSPLISIIVPVFNSQPQWLDKLLTSIHQQSYPTWECLIVDDASPKTRHLAVIQRWCQRDSRFRFIQHQENQYVIGTSGGTKTLAQWRTYSGGKDMNSKANWFTLSTGAPTNSVIFYNDTKAAKAFSLGTTLYRDLDNQPVSCSLTLQPFTSKVLLNFGEVASCPSYLLWTK